MIEGLKGRVEKRLIVIFTALHYSRYSPPSIERPVVSRQQSRCGSASGHLTPDPGCFVPHKVLHVTAKQSDFPTLGPVSDSRNKRITSKLCFISSRLQSGTMNNRSQGTKTEIEKLRSFYVPAVVRIHRELIKIH